MSTYRRALLIVSFLGAVGLALILKAYGDEFETPHLVIFFGVAGLLAANFIYLLQADAPVPGTRFGRMFKLWLDAKEADLKARATPARSPDTGSPGEGR